MRHKDTNKSEAIHQATIELLNEIGFSDISMSKIAKRANVSSSTIYVYFENKEDMLGKLYVNVKRKMSLQMLQDVDETTPVQAGFELLMRNLVAFIVDNKDYFLFLEQFTNSPLIEKLRLEEGAELFKPVFDLIERGKKENVLKQADTALLLMYGYFPVAQLAKEHFKGKLSFHPDTINKMIEMSWDAVKA
ncbi:TetR/AcrR family transcriptional regulator [Paenibacillus sp. MBLB4367]|uniref:TetR/AcrR family transcriptional regulator n=1 Tax=Paenibacillus sp. MBLB4367 TaxID=3384767 RepID=UPI0039081CE0